MAFPAAKLGAILLKQISKPLANVVKQRAKSSPFFRTYICMPPAQFYHWCDVKLKMWAMNLGKPVSVTKLNENMAIELGAEILGEGIIFTIAAVLLILEYLRSSRKEAQKEFERKEQLARIQDELKELYFARARQETQLRELIRMLHINLPSLNYAEPMSFDTDNIPEHHLNERKAEEGTSIYSKLSGILWAAVDLVVPPVEDSGKRDNEGRPIIILKVTDEKDQSGLVPVVSPSPQSTTTPQNVEQSYGKDTIGVPNCGHSHKGVK